MRKTEDIRLDRITKKAWDLNWQDISIKQILEIFKYPRVKKQIKIFRKYIPNNVKILEGGCGLGPYVLYFKNLNYDITGLDYNYRPLKKVKDYRSDINLTCGDVNDIPFMDNSFGCYISLGVIEHFSAGPEQALSEAYRILQENSIFILAVARFSIFHKIKLPIDIIKKNRYLRKLYKKNKKEHYWQQYFGINELAQMLKKRRFSILKILPIDHEYSLINFSSFFRRRNSYDAVNDFGCRLANLCERHMPWATAGSLLIICRKTQKISTI